MPKAAALLRTEFPGAAEDASIGQTNAANGYISGADPSEKGMAASSAPTGGRCRPNHHADGRRENQAAESRFIA